IVVDIARTVHDVDARISERANRGYLKSRWIEPDLAVGKAGRSGRNVVIGIADDIDTRARRRSPGDIEVIRRAETRRERGTGRIAGDTGEIPAIGQNAEDLAVELLAQLRQVVG